MSAEPQPRRRFGLAQATGVDLAADGAAVIAAGLLGRPLVRALR